MLAIDRACPNYLWQEKPRNCYALACLLHEFATHKHIHMSGIRDPWQGIQLSYTSTSHILAKWTGRNSPWRGGRERTPGSHRPRCPPCSPGTRSSWRRIASHRHRNKDSWLQSPKPPPPFCLSQQRNCLRTWRRGNHRQYNGRGDGEWRPNRSLLETPAARTDPGAEMKCRDKPWSFRKLRPARGLGAGRTESGAGWGGRGWFRGGRAPDRRRGASSRRGELAIRSLAEDESSSGRGWGKD